MAHPRRLGAPEQRDGPAVGKIEQLDLDVRVAETLVRAAVTGLQITDEEPTGQTDFRVSG